VTIETGLRTLLLAQAAIVATIPPQTVGKVAFDAIFNEEPAQGLDPAFIVICEVDEDPMLTLDGTYGMRSTTFSVDCYHKSIPEAKVTAKAVQDFLNDYDGPAGDDDTINAVLLQGVTYDKLYNTDGTDTRQRIVKLSYQIQHTAN